jgi:hypothetical protein
MAWDRLSFSEVIGTVACGEVVRSNIRSDRACMWRGRPSMYHTVSVYIQQYGVHCVYAAVWCMTLCVCSSMVYDTVYTQQYGV